MTALPSSPAPIRPMTAAEYAATPEDLEVRYELQEGVLIRMARPTPEHQIAQDEVMFQFRSQLPPELKAVTDIDIDLQIVPAHRPGFVRSPDIAVVTRAGLARRRAEGGILRAAEMVLAVEMVSVGSERTDRVIKRGEYSDAGVPHYWMIDIDERPALTACHLAGEFGYSCDPAATGVFTAVSPFPVRLDLDGLI